MTAAQDHAGAATLPPATRRRFFLLAMMFLHTLNIYLDRVVISAAANDMKADLQLSDQMMGNVFAMFAIGYALFQIPAGWSRSCTRAVPGWDPGGFRPWPVFS